MAWPFGFAGGHGYQEDGDSGLMLLGHRYYDPSAGRFLTRDPSAEGRNVYLYCANNPLKTTDAPGLWDPKIYRQIKNDPSLGDDVAERYKNDPKFARKVHDRIGPYKEEGKGGRNGRGGGRPKGEKNIDDNGDAAGQGISDAVQDVLNHESKAVGRKVAGGVAAGAGAVVAGYLLWEGIKWGIALAAAPGTGGGSIILAGALP